MLCSWSSLFMEVDELPKILKESKGAMKMKANKICPNKTCASQHGPTIRVKNTHSSSSMLFTLIPRCFNRASIRCWITSRGTPGLATRDVSSEDYMTTTDSWLQTCTSCTLHTFLVSPRLVNVTSRLLQKKYVTYKMNPSCSTKLPQQKQHSILSAYHPLRHSHWPP